MEPTEEKLTKHQRYYKKNRDKLVAKSLVRRHADPAAHNARCLASKHKDWDAYLAKSNKRQKQRYLAMRMKAITALGGVCARCNYNADVRALQIDHIASDGKEDRLTLKSQWSLYKSVATLGGQGKYQCLCANCNQIKRMEAEEHPPGRKRK